MANPFCTKSRKKVNILLIRILIYPFIVHEFCPKIENGAIKNTPPVFSDKDFYIEYFSVHVVTYVRRKCRRCAHKCDLSLILPFSTLLHSKSLIWFFVLLHCCGVVENAIFAHLHFSPGRKKGGRKEVVLSSILW